jgi:hypothetical protein
MTLTNLMTVLKTVAMASVKLTVPADRIGLGFGAGLAYPADSLSQGRFPTPHNPEPEQVRSRQGRSAVQMRKQMQGDPGVVPPAGPAGCFLPGSSAGRVSWLFIGGASWSVTSTDTSRNHSPKVCARLRLDRDCQSLDRSDDKHALLREVAPAATAGK